MPRLLIPRLEKILLAVLTGGILLTVIYPFFNLAGVFFPFIFSKGLFIQVISLALLPFWLALVILYPRYRLVNGYRSLITVVIYWGIILIITTLVGADSVRSWWGTAERMTGAYTILSFMLWFLMIVTVFRSKRQWLWLLRGLILGAVIVSAKIIYAGLILHEFRPFAWFGSPGIAGSYLLFFPFFALIWYRLEKLKRGQIVIIILELIFLLALGLTGSRASWLGLLGASVIGFLVWPKSARLRYGGLIIIGVFGIGLAYTATNHLPASWYTRFSPLARVANIVLADASRFMAWDQGLKSWVNRPVFGYGPENYHIAFNRNYDPELIQYTSWGSSLQFDKAHNQPLEHLVDTGIIGLISYLLIFIITIGVLVRRKGFASLVFFMLLIAYFIQNLLSFDTPVTYWLFFISLAYIYFSTNKSSPPDSSERTTKSGSSQIKAAIIIPVSLLVVPVIIYFGSIRAYTASREMAIAQAAADQPIDTVFPYYERALKIKGPQSFEIRQYLGADVLRKVDQYSQQYEQVLQFAALELAKNSRNDYHNLLLLGQIYNILGEQNTQYYKIALADLEQAEKLAGQRYQIQITKAWTLLGLGNLEQSIKTLEQARQNGYQPSEFEELFIFGRLYGQIGDLEQAQTYYIKAYQAKPKQTAVIGALAAVYQQQGNLKKAREMALLMAEIDPTKQAEVDDFLASLGDNLD